MHRVGVGGQLGYMCGDENPQPNRRVDVSGNDSRGLCVRVRYDFQGSPLHRAPSFASAVWEAWACSACSPLASMNGWSARDAGRLAESIQAVHPMRRSAQVPGPIVRGGPHRGPRATSRVLRCRVYAAQGVRSTAAPELYKAHYVMGFRISREESSERSADTNKTEAEKLAEEAVLTYHGKRATGGESGRAGWRAGRPLQQRAAPPALLGASDLSSDRHRIEAVGARAQSGRTGFEAHRGPPRENGGAAASVGSVSYAATFSLARTHHSYVSLSRSRSASITSSRKVAKLRAWPIFRASSSRLCSISW